jgi:hypothetical protein
MPEEYWIIAFFPTDGNWYILDSRDMSKISGPYATHDDIVDGIRTRHYRISQGWKP